MGAARPCPDQGFGGGVAKPGRSHKRGAPCETMRPRLKGTLARLCAAALAAAQLPSARAQATTSEAAGSQPVFPNLDNLLPTQADDRLKRYQTELRQWQQMRLAQFRASEPGPTPTVPPRPVRPKLAGLSPEQQQAANDAYRKQHDAWALLAGEAAAREDVLRRKAGLLPSLEQKASVFGLAADYSWRTEAGASGLSSSTVTQLERNSLAIAGPYYRLSFEVYTRNPQPPFITSDSLLNGFNVLLEESVRRFELSRVAQLRGALEAAWSGMDARLAKARVERAPLAPFARRLALEIGPALRLLGSPVPLGDSDVEAAVAAEVRKIEAAQEVSLPDWLAPATASLAAVDYRRCAPIGIYTEEPELRCYYQAVRWLQMIPLRASRDDEAGAAALWAFMISADAPPTLAGSPASPLRRFIESSSAIFGAAGDPDVPESLAGQIQFSLGKDHRPLADVIRQSGLSIEQSWKLSPPVFNDLLHGKAVPGNRPGDAAVRVLPAARLPDAAWFARVERWRGKEALPYGTQMGAWLGSDLAEEDVIAREGAAIAPLLLAERDARLKRQGNDATLPDLYFATLASLLEKPDPAAPAFMGAQPWARKSLQSALAGWAQFRYTWELQAKANTVSFGIALRPAGFVEPDPAFFARMGDLVDMAVDRFMDQGIFGALTGDDPQLAPPGPALWRRWQTLGRLTRALEVLVQKQLCGSDWSAQDADVLRFYGENLADVMGYQGTAWETPLDRAPRFTTVAHDAGADRDLAIAVGRPRALFVLYPWKGSLILCRGAVMTYYEFPVQRRLTDREWRSQLDGPQAPAQPSWIEPLLPLAR